MARVEAHITGTVWKIEVAVGDTVAEGDTVVILESMKMEMPVESEDEGTVGRSSSRRASRSPRATSSSSWSERDRRERRARRSGPRRSAQIYGDLPRCGGCPVPSVVAAAGSPSCWRARGSPPPRAGALAAEPDLAPEPVPPADAPAPAPWEPIPPLPTPPPPGTAPTVAAADQPVAWRRSRPLGKPFGGRLADGVQLPSGGRDFVTWDPIRGPCPIATGGAGAPIAC